MSSNYESKQQDFFVNHDIKTVQLTSLLTDIAVDTSGSTGGKIIEHEKRSVSRFTEILKGRYLISWNTYAYSVNNINELYSTGTTCPSKILPLLVKTSESNACESLVFYTDGEIDEHEMLLFEKRAKESLNDIPIIVIFAVNTFDQTIKEMEKTITMSIPHAFMALANNVIIIVTYYGYHKVLMSKGCFANVYKQDELENNSVLEYLPHFDLNNLSKVMVPGQLSQNHIILDGYKNPIDLEKIYVAEDIPNDILLKLSNRMNLPRLDIDKMHSILTTISQKSTDNPELKEIRNALLNVAISKKGSREHLELLEKYNKCKKEKKVSEEIKKKRFIINEFLSIIAEYRSNMTGIVLGSNRANRTTVFNENDLEDLGKCPEIEDPITLEEGNACIVIKYCDKNYNDFLKNCTSDLSMEAPFNLGKIFSPLITPGIFTYELAKDMEINPYTRDKIMGFLPLSNDPLIIMKHMSKLFGQNHVMWHFVRAYISMMCDICDKDWIDSKIILSSVIELCKNYNATKDLKGGSEKVPLMESLQYVVINYNTCLRDRFPDDIRALVNVVDKTMPEFKYEKEKIMAMTNVIEVFQELLVQHKNNQDMEKYVMDVDDYGHFKNNKTDLYGLIGQIFWSDTNGNYRLYKLQNAIEMAFSNAKFGKEFKKAFLGEKYNTDCLKIAYDEPVGTHFGEEKYANWDNNGINELQCTFCGDTFNDTQSKRDHLGQYLGKHFYNGLLAVKHAILEIGHFSDNKKIFMKAKELLFTRYTKFAGFLHTQRCKKRLLYFIDMCKKK